MFSTSLKSITGLILLLFFSVSVMAQTIQERLGYTKDTKLLIIHADDLGVSHSENTASIAAMKTGSVTSASILVPCPWFSEIADYARNNPNTDLGLHLAITSEWKHYKWMPVAGSKVPSLVDKQGYFPTGRDGLPETIKAKEVGIEIKAQIERALALGVQPTHLDAHMRAILTKPEYALELLKMAREYKLPIASTTGVFAELLPNEVVSDVVFAQNKLTAGPDDYKDGMAAFYEKTLRSLTPGFTEIVIHTAYDDDEMQAVTTGYESWGSKWRQDDFDFFTSETCKKIIAEEKIQMITWREVRDKLMHKK